MYYVSGIHSLAERTLEDFTDSTSKEKLSMWKKTSADSKTKERSLDPHDLQGSHQGNVGVLFTLN